MRWRWFCLLSAMLTTATTTAMAADACSRPMRIHTSVISPQVYWRDINWLRYVLEQNACELTVLHEDVSSISRLLRSLELGKHDLATGLSITTERMKFLHFSAAYTADRLRLYAHKTNQSLPQTISLTQLYVDKTTIVLPMHGWFGSEFDDFRRRYLDTPGIITYQNDADGLRIVRQQTAAVLVMSERVFISLDSPEQTKLVTRGPELFSDPLHIAFSRRSVSVADVGHIDRAITAMLARGVTPESFAAGMR